MDCAQARHIGLCLRRDRGVARATDTRVAARGLCGRGDWRSAADLGRGHLEKGREVTMTGPYRFTRHPLYLGSTIMGVGLAIAAHSVIVAALVLGYLAVTLAAAIGREEEHLTEKFGAAYPAYRDGFARG